MFPHALAELAWTTPPNTADLVGLIQLLVVFGLLPAIMVLAAIENLPCQRPTKN